MGRQQRSESGRPEMMHVSEAAVRYRREAVRSKEVSLSRINRTLLLICCAIAISAGLLISGVKAELGILRLSVQGRIVSEPSFCFAYDSRWAGRLASEAEYVWSPVLSQPLDACAPLNSTTTKAIAADRHRALLVAERGNCSFLDKAINAQNGGAKGLIVINNSSDILTPGLPNHNRTLNASIPVLGLSYEDGEQLKSLMTEEVLLALYSPSGLPMDPNFLLVWLVAVIVVSSSAYWSNASERARIYSEQRENRETSEEERKREEEEETLHITPRIAICFVIAACIVILIMYFLYRYLAYIVIALFVLGSITSMYAILLSSTQRFMPKKPSFRIVCFGTVSLASLCLLALSASIAILWVVFRHSESRWVLQDVLGICLIATAIKTVKLPNIKVAALLLFLFFLYDVFFVFITPLFTKSGESVMEEVATGAESGSSEQLPLALLFPHLADPYSSVCGWSFSMIGYGDLVIPGMLVALCLRFDYHIHEELRKSRRHTSENPLRVYYLSCAIAYGVGLLLTYLGLIVLHSAQPALFYLVPCTLGIVFFQGWRRGELRLIWHGIDHRERDVAMKVLSQQEDPEADLEGDSETTVALHEDGVDDSVTTTTEEDDSAQRDQSNSLLLNDSLVITARNES